jgi:alkanesulfonate monooxygenase SsuD/methylene tetrahydromethanopterin reductase-like flavin-dependent oxidoreductase (luciferase family)
LHAPFTGSAGSEREGGMRVAMMIEGQEGVSWAQWVALAQAAEEVRLDGLFRSDHYTMIHGFEGGALDAWTTLAALAPLTRTLRLGTMVSPVTFRHPSLMAHIVASVDHISGGRVELGLGAGWYELEHLRNGFAFPPLAERTRLLAEHVEVIIRSWREQDFDHEGGSFTLKGQQSLPKPVQSPSPPLILGGRVGPRSVALAAKHADEYNAFSTSPEDAARCRATLDAACVKIGRDPKTLRQSMVVLSVLGESDHDAERRAQRMIQRLAPSAPLVGAIERMRSAGFVGSAAKVSERLRPFEAHGVSRLFMQNFDFADPSSVALVGEVARSLE